MVWNNRLIKTIVLILGVFVLVINLAIYFQDTQHIDGGWWNWRAIDDFKFWNYDDYNTKFSAQHYFGFNWFFSKLETFPGLRFTTDCITKYANIVSEFKVTDVNIIDVLIAIFRVITTPVVLLFAFLSDVISLLYWFISFIIDGIENPNDKVVDLHSNIGTFSNVPLYAYLLRV